MNAATPLKHALSKSWAPVIGGILFLAAFHSAYSHINPDLYTLRDDAVITLSHARNLVDYGFIGVGPSGERLEGYSAPVQFFLYALLYSIGGVGFSAYAQFQTLACTFLLGFTFTLLFAETTYFALAAAAITSFGLTRLTSFIQWHGSGMENALTHVLFALTAYVLFHFSRKKAINLWLAVIPFLASLSRLDGIYHVIPLLVIFAVFWVLLEKSYKGVAFLGAVVALWGAYNCWRFIYFGDLSPNVAYAQRISVVDRLTDLVTVNRPFISSSRYLADNILSSHGGFYLAIAAPFLIVARWKREYALLLLLSLSVVATAWFNPFVFGPTRLDVTRSTTQMAFFVFVAAGCIVTSITRWRYLLLTPLLLPAFLIADRHTVVERHYVCCPIGPFDGTRRMLAEIAARESLPRPTIANPDLGVVSWYKQFNIVDLGFLGSQVMAKVHDGPVLADYFFDYAAPDIVESRAGGFWTCRHYESIFADSRFRKNYKPIEEGVSRWKECGETDLPVGVWVRRDIVKDSTSHERMFTDALSRRLDPERIAVELTACQSASGRDVDCAYVARAVYRFVPELRGRGQMDRVIEMFANSRTKDADLLLLSGFRNGRANEKAIAFIYRNVLRNRDFKRVKGGHGFDVFVDTRYVAYVNERCRSQDVSAPFYLRVSPSDPAATADGPADMDFNFRAEGFVADGVCGVVRRLPAWKARSVRTGQGLPGPQSSVWEVEVELPK